MIMIDSFSRIWIHTWSAVKETEDPAATETTDVALPEAPPTLQRKSLSLKTVTGELLFVFFLMFWYIAPF
jgi:hypothetical protein